MNKFVKQTAIGLTSAAILVAFLFLASVFASHPAFSQTPAREAKQDGCITLESQQKLVKPFEHVFLTGTKATEFMDLTPLAGKPADHLIILFLKDKARVAVFVGHCMDGVADPPAQAVRAILEKILGTPV